MARCAIRARRRLLKAGGVLVSGAMRGGATSTFHMGKGACLKAAFLIAFRLLQRLLAAPRAPAPAPLLHGFSAQATRAVRAFKFLPFSPRACVSSDSGCVYMGGSARGAWQTTCRLLSLSAGIAIDADAATAACGAYDVALAAACSITSYRAQALASAPLKALDGHRWHRRCHCWRFVCVPRR